MVSRSFYSLPLTCHRTDRLRDGGGTDSPPDDIEDIFDDLDGGGDYHQATAHLTNNQAGWLARYIHERSIKERESINEEIERDLKVGS